MDKAQIYLNFKRFALSLLIFISAYSLSGQVEGCTDPYALNYNPDASWNDGSCFYEETYYIPMQYLDLPATLNETSGLLYWADGIWTFNDSGGDPKIYKVDTVSGNIIQTVTIANGTNVDWEDIDQDEDHIYVGDFGNNAGNRKDLVIYKINKTDIPQTGNVDVTAELIAYSYADQDDFTPHFDDNEYDCEAMIWENDSLYLFTKNWVSNTTRLYALPDEAGSYSIDPIDSLDVGGLVTGATYSEELGQVVLCGYTVYTPFLFLLFDYHDNDYFSGNKRKIQMPGIFGAQTEGVCFKEGYNAFLSCEESLHNQKVFSFSTAEWTDSSLVHIHESQNRFEVSIHPNPVDDNELTIIIQNSVNESYQLHLFDSSGKIVYSGKHSCSAGEDDHSFTIQIPEIRSGIYLLHILSGEFYATEEIIVR